MGRDDDRHKLSGEIEIDECFFKLSPIQDSSHDHLTPVLVMTESQEQLDNKYRIHRKFGHLKMKVVKSITASELMITAEEHIEKSAVLRGDGTSNHNYMKKVFQEVSGEVLNNQSDLLRVLPWTHICIGHSKNLIRDIYHDVTKEYLQLYLDEFCWKKNHRYCKDLFNELLRVSVSMKNMWQPVEDFDIAAFLAAHPEITMRL